MKNWMEQDQALIKKVLKTKNTKILVICISDEIFVFL